MDDNIQAKAQGRFYNDVCESIYATFMSQKWWIVISCLLGKHFNGNSQIHKFAALMSSAMHRHVTHNTLMSYFFL